MAGFQKVAFAAEVAARAARHEAIRPVLAAIAAICAPTATIVTPPLPRRIYDRCPIGYRGLFGAGEHKQLGRWRVRRPTVRTLAIALMLAAGAAAAYGATDAHTRFTQLLAQARIAQHRGDAKALLAASLKLAALLHHSAPATERVAMAYAQLGEQRQALDWLRAFAVMGQTDGVAASRPQFKAIGSLAQFQRVIATMRDNATPIDRANGMIRLPDARLLPEDIDYDSASRTYLLTSVLDKEILRIGAGGVQKVFFRSPESWPMMAVKIDERRQIVWATEVAISGFAGAPRKDWGRSALLCLRLKDGGLLRRMEVPHTALGDMALMPSGEAIVSDGENGGIYRARAGCAHSDLRRIDSGEFISPQTPAPEGDGRHVFVPDYARGIALLDVKTGQARWLDAGRRHAMHGIDGLYLTSKGLLGIQNGAMPERLVLFELDHELRIVHEKIIDRSSPTLGDPTHGVVVDGEFHYIANSGWNWLDDDGRVKPGADFTPAEIKQVAISDL